MKTRKTYSWRFLLTLSMALFMLFSFSELTHAQRKNRKNKKNQTEEPVKKPEPKPKKGALQPYGKVITKDAVSDEGLFSVHKIDDKYFFEIPDSLLGRDMLMVTRIAKTASGLGYGGSKTNTQVLRWEKREKKILLRIVSYSTMAADSLPIHQAVTNSNLNPILATFPIKSLAKDSAGVVIEATPLLTKDIKPLGLPAFRRTQYRVTRMDAERSYVSRVSSYPTNIELRHVKTYAASNPPSNQADGSITVEMSNSMVLLPKEPMRRRYADRRVGYFLNGTTDYGREDQKSKSLSYVQRYRLEVKDEDIEKFKRGELVEPKKQIVYYIDPATPKKWVPYLIQGVNDWNAAFEAAGFKNAIVGKEAPTDDPDWSPEDARYSVIRYLASTIPNASGPRVADPRSGEILESDIQWYHNVMSLLRRWFFAQTAAINPDAQSPQFKDEVMGRLIRFVSSHEVGHTIGLRHNWASSVAYPVDSLRSPSFTKRMGTAPSIMDYARFNYIAQPEDGDVALMPDIGIYDKWSVEFGYRPILEVNSAEAEKPILDGWVESHAGDPLYRWGDERNQIDYTIQREDLGDDAMKATMYGLKNLERITENLVDWTYEPGDPYENLGEMYGALRGQFRLYISHVAKYVGGVKEDYKTADQEGVIYTHAPKAKQKEAVQFLNDNVFQTPKWFLNKEVLNRIQDYGAVESMRTLQVGALNSLLDWRRLGRLIENETLNGSENAYVILDLFSDLRNGIWAELARGRAIDTYRRNLQKAYIERLETLLNEEMPPEPAFFRQFRGPGIDASQSDIRPVVRAELKALKRSIRAAIPRTSDRMSKYHLEDAIERIDKALDNDGD